ncbi:MAG: hypothetical protein K0U74_03220 [Alphaproteobacteria bacterium]|nr:hypothetical protein [Alphaproteobacteria bacterium]
MKQGIIKKIDSVWSYFGASMGAFLTVRAYDIWGSAGSVCTPNLSDQSDVGEIAVDCATAVFDPAAPASSAQAVAMAVSGAVLLANSSWSALNENSISRDIAVGGLLDLTDDLHSGLEPSDLEL